MRSTCPVWSHVCPTEGWRPSAGLGLPCTCVLCLHDGGTAHSQGPGLQERSAILALLRGPWHCHLACPSATPTCKAQQSGGARGLLQVGIRFPFAISLGRHWDLHRWGEFWGKGGQKQMLARSRNYYTVVQSIRIRHYGIAASLGGAKSHEFLDIRPIRWGLPEAEVLSLSHLALHALPLHIRRDEATGSCGPGSSELSGRDMHTVATSCGETKGQKPLSAASAVGSGRIARGHFLSPDTRPQQASPFRAAGTHLEAGGSPRLQPPEGSEPH